MSSFAPRLLVLSTLTLMFVALASPIVLGATTSQVVATEEVQEPAEPVDEGPSGAYIDSPPAESESINPQWTYRFLIPTSLVLIAVVIAGTVVMYFVRVVRTRYTTVE